MGGDGPSNPLGDWLYIVALGVVASFWAFVVIVLRAINMLS